MKEKLNELLDTMIDEYEGKNLSTEKIADYLIQNGVVLLPCKVGDIVWLAFSCLDSEAVKGKISMLQQRADGSWKIRVADSVGVNDFPITEIGDVIFFTKEEAEKKLKERKE